MASPKSTATKINMVFRTPSVPKDSFMIMVEIIKPEFLITLLNLSVTKNENNKINTSTRIRTVKKSSKKILLTSFIVFTRFEIEKKLS